MKKFCIATQKNKVPTTIAVVMAKSKKQAITIVKKQTNNFALYLAVRNDKRLFVWEV